MITKMIRAYLKLLVVAAIAISMIMIMRVLGASCSSRLFGLFRALEGSLGFLKVLWGSSELLRPA